MGVPRPERGPVCDVSDRSVRLAYASCPTSFPQIFVPSHGCLFTFFYCSLEGGASTSQYALLPLFSQGSLVDPRMRASDEHSFIVRVLRARKIIWPFPSHFYYFTRNGFEFSPEAVVTVRRTSPFFPPLGTVVVMLLLVW